MSHWATETGIPSTNTGYVEHGISADIELNERGTNWEAGLSEVRDVIMPGTEMASRPGVPLLVLHITDGKPNEYIGPDGNFVYDSSDNTTPLANAVEIADEIKEDLGAHMVTVAVGDIAATAVDWVKAISGPDIHNVADPDSTLDILKDDLILVEEPDGLVPLIENIFADLCAPRLEIRQWIQDASGSGNSELVEGWTVDVGPGSSDSAYNWQTPSAGSQVTSDENGFAEFHWHVLNHSAWNANDLIVSALDGGDDWILQNVVCEATLGERAGTELAPSLSLDDRQFTLDLNHNEVVKCDLYNVARTDNSGPNLPQLALVQSVQSIVSIQTGQSGATDSYSCPGDKITFSYNVFNTGNAATSGAIEVSDTALDNVVCPTPSGGQIEGVLSAQEALVCTGIYTVTQEDIDAGVVQSAAWAVSGTSSSAPSDLNVSATPSTNACPDDSGNGNAGNAGNGNAGGENPGGENAGGEQTGGENAGSENSGSENTDNGNTEGGNSEGENTAVENTKDKKPNGKGDNSKGNNAKGEKATAASGGDSEDRIGDPAAATRGAKWFSGNQDYVAACLNSLGGQIDLGTLVIRDESYDDEVDATVKGIVRGDADVDVESALSMTVGLLNARGGKLSNDRRRGKLARSCVRATQQMLVARCNIAVFGAQPWFDLDRDVARLAKHCGSESTAAAARKRIDAVRARLLGFNRAGKNTALPALDIQSTGSDVQGDDPTDHTD